MSTNKMPNGKDLRWAPVRDLDSPAEIVSEFSLLKGAKGREYLGRYSESVNRVYGNNPNLDVLNYNGQGVVTGANIFSDVHLDKEVILPDNLRVANQLDLERIYFQSAIDFRPVYSITGLMLTSEERPNKRLAQILSNDLRKRFNMKLEELSGSVYIPVSDLDMFRHDNEYGLGFKFAEEAKKPEVVPFKFASVFRRFLNLFSECNGSFYSASMNRKNGFPSEINVEDGDRYLSLPRSGLTAVRFDDGIIFSDVEDLAESDADGRIILIKDPNQRRKAKKFHVCTAHDGYSG